MGEDIPMKRAFCSDERRTGDEFILLSVGLERPAYFLKYSPR